MPTTPMANPAESISRLQGYGGTIVVMVHVAVTPAGLADSGILVSIFVHGTLFLVLGFMALAAARTRFQLAFIISVVIASASVRLCAPKNDANLQAMADLGLATCGAIIMWSLVNHVLRARVVSPRLVVAAIGLYLLSGVTWAFGFQAIESFLPGAFVGAEEGAKATASDLYYLSFVTLTTLGYGEISPVHPLARSVAVLEAAFGQLYLVVLLGRIVSIELSSRPAVSRLSAALSERERDAA